MAIASNGVGKHLFSDTSSTSAKSFAQNSQKYTENLVVMRYCTETCFCRLSDHRRVSSDSDRQNTNLQRDALLTSGVDTGGSTSLELSTRPVLIENGG